MPKGIASKIRHCIIVLGFHINSKSMDLYFIGIINQQVEMKNSTEFQLRACKILGEFRHTKYSLVIYACITASANVILHALKRWIDSIQRKGIFFLSAYVILNVSMTLFLSPMEQCTSKLVLNVHVFEGPLKRPIKLRNNIYNFKFLSMIYHYNIYTKYFVI